jgi:hypothetical protein
MELTAACNQLAVGTFSVASMITLQRLGEVTRVCFPKMTQPGF